MRVLYIVFVQFSCLIEAIHCVIARATSPTAIPELKLDCPTFPSDVIELQSIKGPLGSCSISKCQVWLDERRKKVSNLNSGEGRQWKGSNELGQSQCETVASRSDLGPLTIYHSPLRSKYCLFLFPGKAQVSSADRKYDVTPATKTKEQSRIKYLRKKKTDDLLDDAFLNVTLKYLGFEKPLDFQTAALDTASAGRDFMVHAPAGSGKSLALLLPVLQWHASSLMKDGRVKALMDPQCSLRSDVRKPCPAVVSVMSEEIGKALHMARAVSLVIAPTKNLCSQLTRDLKQAGVAIRLAIKRLKYHSSRRSQHFSATHAPLPRLLLLREALDTDISPFRDTGPELGG